MKTTLDVLLLLALPASGKSEVRKFLAAHGPEECRSLFFLGPTVQLDDYPYVHLMRRIDDELERMGQPRVFFRSPDEGFADSRDWITLIELLNDDWASLHRPPADLPPRCAETLMDRIEAASDRAGIGPRLARLRTDRRRALEDELETESRMLLEDLQEAIPPSLEGRTVVIEFARGGPDGSAMPLPDPLGYRASLQRLAPDLLAKAAVLYIWVTPEESRRKNQERADPTQPGSILHHGVPMPVMLGEYGCDDMEWLIGQSDRPGTLRVEAHGRTFHLPAARLDNRVDRTTFVRGPRDEWDPRAIETLRSALHDALKSLASTPRD